MIYIYHLRCDNDS